MKWTPTAEQLPDDMRFVWVTIDRAETAPRTRVGWYDKDQGRIESSVGYIPLAPGETVTAFMDIPTCPPPYMVTPDYCTYCGHAEYEHGSEPRWYCISGCNCQAFDKGEKSNENPISEHQKSVTSVV